MTVEHSACHDHLSGVPAWAQLVELAQEQLEGLTDQLVGRIEHQNLGYNELGTVPHDDLHRSCHHNIVRVFQLIMDSPDAVNTDAMHFDAARMTGKQRAEQGMPLDDVLRSFRIGGQLIWETLNDMIRCQHEFDSDNMRELGTRLWAAVDAASSQVAASYHSTTMRMLRADEQRRAELWEDLLSGRATDPAFAIEAARLLDLPVDGRFLIAIMQHSGEQIDCMVNAATSLLQKRGMASAWQVRKDATVGLIALLDQPVSLVDDALRAAGSGPSGISFVISGVAEANIGHRQALLALRSSDADHRGTVALHNRVPQALLLNSPDLTRHLVSQWLGPLLILPNADKEPLIEALRIWVDTGGSAQATARLLHCHRNTVINRLNRINEVLGYAASAVPLPIELPLALKAYDLGLADTTVTPE